MSDQFGISSHLFFYRSVCVLLQCRRMLACPGQNKTVVQSHNHRAAVVGEQISEGTSIIFFGRLLNASI